MAVETMTTPRSNLPNVYTDVTAREIDFVSRFTDNWDALRDIMGISRPIRKAPGTQLVAYGANVDLAPGDVTPGTVIPYSKTNLTKVSFANLDVLKFAKAVPIEDVNMYGAEIAVQKSDDAFLYELQNVVLGEFYKVLQNDSREAALPDAENLQMALAKAKGSVIDYFNKIRKTVTDVVAFVNVLDFYEYLGTAPIVTQTAFGMTYIENFMGYSRIFLLSEPDIERGKVIALPVENMILYYVDPSDSEFAKLGLNYTVQGETNLIGFHAQGNYGTAVGESFALLGMRLWVECPEGVANISFGIVE